MATPSQLAEKEALKNRARSPSPIAQDAPPARYAPPLPPRTISNINSPPLYSTHDSKASDLIQPNTDPRSSSTQSLLPPDTDRDGRQKLLLVYIHGFMGKETSFQHFPAHIHNILTITLAETHVIHTKIYPKYKSRGAVEFASEDFSNWLGPHKDNMTDVILLGHSMGGLLAAEVVLRASSSRTSQTLRNCILGTISFDSPFLGIHPGAISSGIGSLFRSTSDSPKWDRQGLPQDEASSSNMASQVSISPTGNESSIVDTASSLSQISSSPSPLASPSPDDPNFNPPFSNDIRIKERDRWNSMLHFIHKHSGGLTSATKQYFMSHIEFGSCLADYPGLIDRYQRLRVLEDINEHTTRHDLADRPRMKRVRFANYYTASTGRLKSPAGKKKEDGETRNSLGVGMSEMSLNSIENHSSESIPKISIERSPSNPTLSPKIEDNPDISSIDETTQNSEKSEEDGAEELQEMLILDPAPIDEDDELQKCAAIEITIELQRTSQEYSLSASESQLPLIPDMPVEPSPVDLSLSADKEHRKAVEKEYKRKMKVYQQAVKDREHAIKDRRKLAEKQEKKARHERERELKAEEKRLQKEVKEQKKQEAAVSQSQLAESSQAANVKNEKKFCLLPTKVDGEIDRCWIKVYMEGVDEVGAHCGLFLPGVHYENLVGDVTTRIEEWVKEDASRRALHNAEISSWD